jgi:alpha-mannosidase
VSFEAKIRSSVIRTEYTLDKGAKTLKAHIRADWSETGGDKVPVLAYEFPTSAETDRFAYNVPGGVQIRPAARGDRPGLSYIAAHTDCPCDRIGIVTDSKYGFRGTAEDGRATLLSTLINSATSPDPYPERGIHEITLTLGLLSACPVEREYAAAAFNRPMTPVSAGQHKGTLPAAGTLLRASADTGVLSAVFADGDKITARFYSVSDKPGTMVFDPGKPVRAAYLTDLNGRKTGECSADGTVLTAVLAPHAVAQITAEV